MGVPRRIVDAVRRRAEQWSDQLWAVGVQRLHPHDAVPFDGDPRFAIVTVNYSTTRWLKLMLRTLAEQTAASRIQRIVVVDNGSRDGGRAFLRALARATSAVRVVENDLFLSHARGMRLGLRALDRSDRSQPPARRANVILSIDTDVVFRRAETLEELARVFTNRDAAAVGELRNHLYPYPEAQASFLAVRRDVYARRDVAPWVNHGAPAYWLQRDLHRRGLNVVHFPSNAGGYVLHRGRAGVDAAIRWRPWSSYGSTAYKNPHFMGIPDGASIWAALEARHEAVLGDGAERALIDLLATRFSAAG